MYHIGIYNSNKKAGHESYHRIIIYFHLFIKYIHLIHYDEFLKGAVSNYIYVYIENYKGGSRIWGQRHIRNADAGLDRLCSYKNDDIADTNWNPFASYVHC